jgi:hypothetical protein
VELRRRDAQRRASAALRVLARGDPIFRSV